jgi:tRNA A-37 threonylcarbamoyl transferase component Bud32
MADDPPAADTPPDLTGRTLGDFQVLRKIGQGGMGQVYLARQVSLKRQVALKILRDDHTANPVALKRFQAEAEAVARISHPNIVQVHAVGEHDGLRYMALEYVDGRNLRDYLERKGAPELAVAVAVLKQVAAALLRAAELGLVHRDVKPENILLTRKVEVKVTDFGLSRYFATDGEPLSLTQSGMTLGTPLYMSPEQVQGQAVDHRSDLYSFGVTAYHLLAGFPPFKGSTAFEVAAKHVQQDPEPLGTFRPDLPADLLALVHRLMAKNPADRYQTAKDVIRDLGRIQKGLAVEGGAAPAPLSVSMSGTAVKPVPPAVPRPPSRWPGRVAAVLLVLFVAAVGWWLSGLTDSRGGQSVPTPAVGLAEVRLPTPLVSSRETTLRDQMEKAGPHSREHLTAVFELGLLLTAERRWDEAEKLFKGLEAGPKANKADGLPVSPAVLGKLGQAIVFAHQDKTKDSIEAFAAAVNAIQPRGQMKQAVERLCFDHPAIGQAIAEAVNRDMDNAKADEVPATVRWLRTPSSVLSGPK